MDPRPPPHDPTQAQPARAPDYGQPEPSGWFTSGQRNTLVALAAVIGGLLAILAVVLITSSDPGDVFSGAADRDFVALPSDDGTTTGTGGTGVATSTSSTDTTSTTAPESTTTSSTLDPACRNSFNANCGEFSWDPQPGPNAPLRIEVDVIPENPRRGQEVAFQVRVTDDDALIDSECNFVVDYGDGNREPACNNQPACARPYGPHTPPEKKPDFYQAQFRHTYARDGAYTVRFSFRSGEPCNDPYASSATVEVIVKVDPTLLPAT